MKQIADPKLIIRFCSIKDRASMRFAMIWTPVFLGISLLCVFCIGAFVHAMVTQEEATQLIQNTDQVVGTMFNKFNSPLATGLCMMGLFAAGMSSLASVILIAGTSIVKDVWHIWRPMSDHKMVAVPKRVCSCTAYWCLSLRYIHQRGLLRCLLQAEDVF